MQSVHVAVNLPAGDVDAGEEHQHDPHRQQQHELQSLLVLQTPVVASRSAVVDPEKFGESGDPHGEAPVVGGAVSNVHEEPSIGYSEKCRHGGGGGEVSSEGSEGLSLDSTFTSRSAGPTPDGKPRAQRDVTTACVSQVQWVLLTSVCVCVCVCVCACGCGCVSMCVRVGFTTEC